MRLRAFATVFSVLILSSSIVWAQFDTGSITGTIFDPAGRSIPGAKIRLINRETGINIEASTNDLGIYEFPAVRVGAYRMTAEKTGFSSATIDQLVVSI